MTAPGRMLKFIHAPQDRISIPDTDCIERPQPLATHMSIDWTDTKHGICPQTAGRDQNDLPVTFLSRRIAPLKNPPVRVGRPPETESNLATNVSKKLALVANHYTEIGDPVPIQGIVPPHSTKRMEQFNLESSPIGTSIVKQKQCLIKPDLPSTG
ncbi:MAG: hypothetical protein V4568_00715 [Pseudomonadota bacterium]